MKANQKGDHHCTITPDALGTCGTSGSWYQGHSGVTFTPTEDFGILIGRLTFKFQSSRFAPALPDLQISLAYGTRRAGSSAGYYGSANTEANSTGRGLDSLPPPFTFTSHKRPSTGLRRRYRDCASSLLLVSSRASCSLLAEGSAGHVWRAV